MLVGQGLQGIDGAGHGVAGGGAVRVRSASSTRLIEATTISPSTENGSRYGAEPVSPYREATPAMCQYDTQAAMPAMTAVAVIRAADNERRRMGTRVIHSTVSSSATGGQAAMVWLIGFARACSTFAATDAATPRVRVSRRPQRRRVMWVMFGLMPRSPR